MVILILFLVLCTPTYAVKYYGEWAGQSDWATVKPYSNVVTVNVDAAAGSDRQKAQSAMQTALNMGYKIVGTLGGSLDPGSFDGTITNFYDTIQPYTNDVVAAYFYDEPLLHASREGKNATQTGLLVKEFCDKYQQEGQKRGINIPGFISFNGSAEAKSVGVPDSMGLPGMFTYFTPTSQSTDSTQRGKYVGVVQHDINELKRIAGTRPIMLIGQSFDNGTGFPSAGQQQWYIDDIKSDPQIYLFLWFHYGETKKVPELVSAHSTFGPQVIDVGVHNVTVSITGTTVTIKWQTNLPSESGTVEYGANSGYGKSVPDETPSSTDHIAHITNLNLGEPVNYKVTSRKSGFTEGPYTGIFTAGTSTLTGTVKTETSATVLPGTKVYLTPGNYATTTNTNGVYTFTNIPPGTYTVTTHRESHKITQTINLNNGTTSSLDFTYPSTSGIFKNGGFETGDLTGWTVIEGVDPGTDIHQSGTKGVPAVPAHDGNYLFGKIVNNQYGRGKIYQQFNTTVGNTVTVNVPIYIDSWDGYLGSGIFHDNYVKLGIDPYGGTDPNGSTVIWSESGEAFRVWGFMHLNTVAQKDTVTVFIEIYQLQRHEWNMTVVDDVTVQSTVVPDTTPPPAPMLSTPINGFTTNNYAVNFDWLDVVDNKSPTVTYELQIAKDTNFSTVYYSTMTINSSSVIINLSSSIYSWRVRARDNAGNNSSWSTVRNFTVSASEIIPPSIPTLLFPPDNLTTNYSLLNFDWTDVTDTQYPPVTYELHISKDVNFTTIDHSTITINSSFVISNMSSGIYYWRVRVRDNASLSNTSNWTVSWSFTVNTTPGADIIPPPVPDLVYPTNNLTTNNQTLNFDWTDVTDDKSPPVMYELQIAKDANFTGWVDKSTPTVSYQLITVSSSGLYYWRVRARDNVGNGSGWSSTYNFSLNLITGGKELQSGEVRAVIVGTYKPGTVSPSKNESVKLKFKTKSTSTTGGTYELKIMDTMGNIVDTYKKSTTFTEDEFIWAPKKTIPSGVYITYIEGPGVKSFDKLIVGK